MRSALLTVLLIGCSLGPPPSIAAPAPQGCSDVAHGSVGTWTRDHSTMEVRADGSVLRDGLEGALRWTSPGVATLDFAGSHEDHTIGMMSGAQMLDVDRDGRARVWTRVSLVPAYPDGCFRVRGSLVGDWTDGLASESFLSDGTYVRGEQRGNWSITDEGALEVAIGLRVRRYRVALAAPGLLVSALDGVPLDEDARAATLVEVRMR